MRYVLWVVALLNAFDVANNDQHLGRQLGFYHELEIMFKLQEKVIFFVLNMNEALCMILATRFTFFVERK